eukprot:TRINITY_DN7175_c0_g1_i1.p1 TRINITY_DN7175_c0_g1~~TRINITY_DN7175_c0_g1_i1.p1  ORF type:complete len:459 (+),score=121.05 TRINITY_DN7175_c0_g1_i1:89-1465(+)
MGSCSGKKHRDGPPAGSSAPPPPALTVTRCDDSEGDDGSCPASPRVGPWAAGPVSRLDRSQVCIGRQPSTDFARRVGRQRSRLSAGTDCGEISFRSCVSGALGAMEADEPEEEPVLVTVARAEELRQETTPQQPVLRMPDGTLLPPDMQLRPPGSGAQPDRSAARRRRGASFNKAPPSRSLPPGLGEKLAQACAAGAKKPQCRRMDAWDFTGKPEHVDFLATGGALFACAPVAGANLKPVERAMINSFKDLSAFADEAAENDILPVNLSDVKERASYIVLITKGMYLLPDTVKAEVLTPQLYSSQAYQKAIAPKGTSVFAPDKVLDRDKRPATDTFCTKREIVPWIFSITTQFRVSEIPEDKLQELAALADGLPLCRGLLLERTKQDRKQDPTKRSKQVILLHKLQDGALLVSHVGFSIFTSLPAVAQKVLDKIGDKGAGEAGEIAQKTREALLRASG